MKDIQDRLSALPDSVIHHILSFLPSTKEIIRTGILSKSWSHHWTHVPVLIFDFRDELTYVPPFRDVSEYIDSTLKLFDCSKLKVFYLATTSSSGSYDRYIRYAWLRNVEELTLNFYCSKIEYKLPEFLFDSPSLVQFYPHFCSFEPGLKFSFKSLKVLDFYKCKFGNGVIENIIFGSPVLESLAFNQNSGYEQLSIVSKSLKCLSLHAQLCCASVLEIDCLKLEELDLSSVDATSFRIKLPPLKSATLIRNFIDDFNEDLVKQLVEQIPHADKLKLVYQFIKVAFRVGGLRTPLNNKSLTLECYLDMELPEIMYALCNSPLLEKLVIEFPYGHNDAYNLHSLDEFEEMYSNSNGNGYTCLESHLKIVEIICVSKKNCKVALLLVEYLLKNARVLEKMVVTIKAKKMEFRAQVSQKLLNFPRSSRHAIVELLCDSDYY